MNRLFMEVIYPDELQLKDHYIFNLHHSFGQLFMVSYL